MTWRHYTAICGLALLGTLACVVGAAVAGLVLFGAAWIAFVVSYD